MQQLEQFIFSTGSDSKVFYSGPANNIKASLYSKMTGKITIDQTEAGIWLKNQALYNRLGPRMADNIWISASQKYATSATGDVYVFAGGANPSRFFILLSYQYLRAIHW